MSEENGDTKLDVSKSGISISGKKTAELITILSLVVTAILAFGLWAHDKSTASSAENLHQILKESNETQKAMLQAQREQNCLISLPQGQRENQAQFCKQISR